MKSNVYTRTGDAGTTSLVDGSRRGKNDLRIESYGEIDELSSALGLAIATRGCTEEMRDELIAVQHVLFEIGAYLATPVAPESEPELPGIKEDTEKLEGWIDSIDERLPKMRSFILPGGNELSGRLHLARTVCRRAERHIVSLAQKSFVDPLVIGYINRLSDYLFVAARYGNFIEGVSEIAWLPRSVRN